MAISLSLLGTGGFFCPPVQTPSATAEVTKSTHAGLLMSMALLRLQLRLELLLKLLLRLLSMVHAVGEGLLREDGQTDSSRVLLVASVRRSKQSTNSGSSSGQAETIDALAETAAVTSLLLWSIKHTVDEHVVTGVSVDSSLLIRKDLLLLLLERCD